MSGALRGQKKVPSSLELKAQLVESHHVDVGNQIQFISKSNNYSYMLMPPPAPFFKSKII